MNSHLRLRRCESHRNKACLLVKYGAAAAELWVYVYLFPCVQQQQRGVLLWPAPCISSLHIFSNSQMVLHAFFFFLAQMVEDGKKKKNPRALWAHAAAERRVCIIWRGYHNHSSCHQWLSRSGPGDTKSAGRRAAVLERWIIRGAGRII